MFIGTCLVTTAPVSAFGVRQRQGASESEATLWRVWRTRERRREEKTEGEEDRHRGGEMKEGEEEEEEEERK